MSSKMKQTQKRKRCILANIENTFCISPSIGTKQSDSSSWETAVRRKIPSFYKELWEVILLNSYSLNIMGSFELPFLKVLLTFSKNLISIYAAEDGTATLFSFLI